MSQVVFKAKARQFKNGCLLLPATPADKKVLDCFCQTIGTRYATVTANFSRVNKSYDQVKTVFALSALLFQINYDRKPTQNENEAMYNSLLEMFADRKPDLLQPNKTVPIHLSEMSKYQAMRFINSIIGLVIEYCPDLGDAEAMEVKQIFEEFQEESNTGENNPIDYDENGNLLSIDAWCERNCVSMASGINDGTLEIAHIISKGSHPQYRNCVWNFLRLTHYEHLEIQHRKGWKELLSIYPHLTKRVKAAYDQAHIIYPFTMTDTFNSLDESESQAIDNKGNQSPTSSLADEALHAAKIPEEDGLF